MWLNPVNSATRRIWQDPAVTSAPKQTQGLQWDSDYCRGPARLVGLLNVASVEEKMLFPCRRDVNPGFLLWGEPGVWGPVAWHPVSACQVVQVGAGADPHSSGQMRFLGLAGAKLEAPGGKKMKKMRHSKKFSSRLSSAAMDLGTWVKLRCLHPISAGSISFWDRP